MVFDFVWPHRESFRLACGVTRCDLRTTLPTMVSPGAKLQPGGTASSIFSSADEAIFCSNSMMIDILTVGVELHFWLLVVDFAIYI